MARSAPSELSRAADRLMRAMEAPFQIDGRRVYATVSIGGSLYPDSATNWQSLFRRADTASHHGKREGGDCYLDFLPAMEEEASRWTTYHSALKYALEHDEIYAVFQPQLVPWLRQAVSDAGLTPADVELEVTESVVMQDAEVGAEVLRDLALNDFPIAIDDFGTGYSSLNYLSTLDVDVLKIDKSFIDYVDTDPDRAKIAKAIIALGKNLNLSVVAEGVETAKQLAFVHQHGCDLVQDYFSSKPLGADEVIGYLEEHQYRQVAGLDSGAQNTDK